MTTETIRLIDLVAVSLRDAIETGNFANAEALSGVIKLLSESEQTLGQWINVAKPERL